MNNTQNLRWLHGAIAALLCLPWFGCATTPPADVQSESSLAKMAIEEPAAIEEQVSAAEAGENQPETSENDVQISFASTPNCPGGNCATGEVLVAQGPTFSVTDSNVPVPYSASPSSIHAARLYADNKELRTQNEELKTELAEVQKQLNGNRQEIDSLRSEYQALREELATARSQLESRDREIQNAIQRFQLSEKQHLNELDTLIQLVRDAVDEHQE